MKRFPYVSGSFYPATPSALKKAVSGYLLEIKEKINAIGLVSPHAGYIYSGKTAGLGYSCLKKKEVYIIVSPNHTGAGEPASIMSEGEWIIPLGTLKIDRVAKEILKSSAFLKEDNYAHMNEHSIEVQLPFIKTVNPAASFVPISLMNYGADVLEDISSAIAKSCTDIKDKILLVASSDMTHYESAESAKAKDKLAIEQVLAMAEDEFIKVIKENDISACGWGPVAVIMKAARLLGAKKAKLIDYSTSGDVSFDFASVVGYASIAIY